MTFETITTIVILLGMIVALFKEWAKPIILFGMATVLFTLSGIISPAELLSGFANEQVAVIILLLIVSGIIQKARLLEHWLNSIFKKANSYPRFIIRMVPFTALISAFLNNTPVVASFIPYIFSWGKKNKISPSRLLMPLSFAAIIGGTMTLIGTSTNLIVNGLAKNNGLSGFEVFDFIIVGGPVLLFGLFYMYFFGEKLLPDTSGALDELNQHTNTYLVETLVLPDSPLINKTVIEADLRQLQGLFLVEIVRGKRRIGPVKPSQNIRVGDHLIFAGETDALNDLVQSNLGLELPKLRDIPQQELIETVEAVVSFNSSLAGKAVKATDFRGTYDAAIVGIHRNGERLSGKIGDIMLEVGDLLLLMTGKDFRKRLSRSEFYLLSTVNEIPNLNRKKGWLITMTAVLTIVLAAFGVMSLFKLLLVFIGLCILLKWVKAGEIQKSLDVNLAFIAALSLAVGIAMENSGTAQLLAQGLSQMLGGFGSVGLLIGIYLLTNILTEFVTNVAAATLAIPVALSLSGALGLDPTPFVMCVAFAASFSFLTPVGYQTNLMVYGPGGYKFRDFFKFGLPLSFGCFVLTVAILSLKFQLF